MQSGVENVLWAEQCAAPTWRDLDINECIWGDSAPTNYVGVTLCGYPFYYIQIRAGTLARPYVEIIGESLIPRV